MRRGLICRRIPIAGYRIHRSCPGIRPHRRHHGLCRRTHLRRPLQPSHQLRTGRRQALPGFRLDPLRDCPNRRRNRGSRCAPHHRQREGGFRHAGFASNGYGLHSPGGYSALSAFVAEVVLTAFFLLVVMGSTDSRAPKGFAALAIGLCLTLIHLICIPVTNTSVNPARSTGPAIFAGGWALQQLWMFWVAPLIGGALGGGIYRALFAE